MKIIAYYLPQFHRIPENDRWWGDGFTEWTNTRKARPLYRGHQQPKEPLDNYYYDLTSPGARKWQAEVARSYGIHGFCYYHYWFKGKKLLEQPLEQMLESGQPEFPFCLSWANETWTRRWDGGADQILIRQEYGDPEDWATHFYALLGTFRDQRYIRVDDKPLFIIYRPGDIPECERMLDYWNELAVKNGLPGIYFVRTLGGFPIPHQHRFEASVEFEPHYTFAHSGTERIWQHIRTEGQDHLVFDYDHIWQTILNRSHHRSGESIFPGAYVNWDNTPRLGVKGQSCIGASPSKFGWYLSKQIERAKTLYQSEFLFINAWNEWAEGAYLEPDKYTGFQYLDAVKRALQHNGYSVDQQTAPSSAKNSIIYS